MSHAPERKEKDCLNCGTIIHGRFCHVCGQENVVPKESFWHLVVHFFYDITHFDSKFFDTLRYLLFRPGFLPKEYIRGRRASYLNPIKMYVFTSAIFFLIFFSLFDAGNAIRLSTEKRLSPEERQEQIEELREDLKNNPADSTIKKFQIALLSDTSQQLTLGQLLAPDTATKFNFLFYDIPYKNQEEYDSVLRTPAGQKDGWFKRRAIRKGIDVANDFRLNRKDQLKVMSSQFLHKLPYLLFVSLPFFALILKLLYLRRKQFYYVDHGLFTIYHYIFSFILMLVFFGLAQLESVAKNTAVDIMIFLCVLAWPVYLFIAMRRFYTQGWFKTFFKFLLLNMLGIMMLLVLFAVFVVITIFL